jgi:hypothetical protein
MSISRPPLRAIPLADVLPLGSRPVVVVTMSIGQWDALLASSYDLGFVLLELDADERPIGAYQAAGGPGAVSS